VRVAWLVFALRDLLVHPERFPLSNPLLTTGAIGLTAAWLSACCLVPLVCYFSPRLRRWSPILELSLITPLMMFLAANESAFDLYQLPVFSVGYFCFRKRDVPLYLPAVLGIPALAGAVYGYPLETIADELINNAIMFVIGVCFRVMISAHATIREQNRTLENYSRQIERLTAEEERNRIAGELHDTVGHAFTSTILGMEAIHCQMDPSSAQARSLKQLAEFARTGYADVRRHIHQIATVEDDQPLVGSLARISREFGEHTDTRVTFRVTGEEPAVPGASGVRVALIRCLQEALTNAKRHGHATEIAVALSFTPAAIAMSVTDNGSGREQIEAGFGLNKMTERIAGLGGALEVRSGTNRGTSVTCTIPWKAG